MSVGEAARHHLYERLRDVLGDEAAMTLMAHVPPFDWREIATKRDLEEFEERLVHRFRSELHQTITAQTRTVVLAMLGSALGSGVSVGTLVLVATQLG